MSFGIWAAHTCHLSLNMKQRLHIWLLHKAACGFCPCGGRATSPWWSSCCDTEPIPPSQTGKVTTLSTSPSSSSTWPSQRISWQRDRWDCTRATFLPLWPQHWLSLHVEGFFSQDVDEPDANGQTPVMLAAQKIIGWGKTRYHWGKLLYPTLFIPSIRGEKNPELLTSVSKPPFIFPAQNRPSSWLKTTPLWAPWTKWTGTRRCTAPCWQETWTLPTSCWRPAPALMRKTSVWVWELDAVTFSYLRGSINQWPRPNAHLWPLQGHTPIDLAHQVRSPLLIHMLNHVKQERIRSNSRCLRIVNRYRVCSRNTHTHTHTPNHRNTGPLLTR